MPEKKQRCCYREGNRRCASTKTSGNPPLCQPHQIAVAEAGRPRSPAQVIAETVMSFMQGQPINREATIGAVEQFISQWASGVGAGYHPDVHDNHGEDAVHRRAAHGQRRTWWWPGGPSAPGAPGAGPRGQQPPPDEAREIREAMRVLEFTDRSQVTADNIRRTVRRLAKRHHPDVQGGSAAKMSRITNAAHVLLSSLRGP